MSVSQLIIPVFKTRGWINQNPLNGLVGMKTVATYLYTKGAHAYCHDRHDGYNYSISGSYYSEGRNILQTRAVLIPLNSSVNQIVSLAHKFIDQAEAEISDSFLVRLLRLNNVEANNEY